MLQKVLKDRFTGRGVAGTMSIERYQENKLVPVVQSDFCSRISYVEGEKHLNGCCYVISYLVYGC